MKMGSKVTPVEVEAGAPPDAPPSPWDLDVVKLNDINSNKDGEALRSHGGAIGLAKILGSDAQHGLADDSAVQQHAQVFGMNKFKEAPPVSFFELVWGNLQDPVVQLLCAAAAISTVLGAAIPDERAKNGWIEGVAIWVAVILVTCVGAGNDYNKDKQFRKLNAQKDTIQVKVVRGGHQVLVSNHDVVVGDLILLDMGDKVVADGVLIESFGLVIDEASLTGESDPIKKDMEHDPWIRSGTQVSEGSGRMIIVAVGTNSEWGKTMELMEDAGDEQTPLQLKLEDVAAAVGKVGMGVAVACFIALLIKWCVENNGFPISKVNDNGPVQFFLYAVTIIVVAVPEGLPLAVTISLAYSMKKMMRDNNFVRVLQACETMGGATAICSDKTGTLTENRMTVVEGWFSGKLFDHAPVPAELKKDLVQDLIMNMALNSKAFLVETPGKPIEFVGNRTECALLMLMRSWEEDYNKIREQYEADIFKLYGFTSARKMASVLVRRGDNYRVYNKGAAEWVLKKCSHLYNEYGDKIEMTPEVLESMIEVVTSMAKRGLRCICLSYKDMPVDDPNRPEDFFEEPMNVNCDLCAIAIVGIKDPVRKEVPDAVATCQKAGITVRMVTGDNIHTAQHIARECGILVDNCIAMEGPTFRAMPANELMPILPKLRVLARSSPEDKLTLVSMLKQQGEVVAVTGDGTNDAPALKESDVGLAMGIAGTEVAKEAADIVIMDDNFSSIVKSVLWGRSVFNNIRKFLQFQLTVNAVALVISFIGAIVGGHEPLNVLQLLWVNLIMDTMGALALATEEPTKDLLDQAPHGRDAPLINKKMWKHISVQATYQLFWMLICLYGLPSFLSTYKITSDTDYYNDNCLSNTYDHLGLNATALARPTSINDTMVSAQWHCSIMESCGWPLGNRQMTCILNVNAGGPYAFGRIPDDAYRALCGVNWGNNTVNEAVAYNGADPGPCPLYDRFSSAQDYMSEEYTLRVEEDWKKPLSLLFNAFIMMQVANEVNARRINDEYSIFSGILTNPIFLSVIFITIGLQALIINALGLFFKVTRLNGIEWLVSFAIGAGAWPVSFLTRFVSRVVEARQKKREEQQQKQLSLKTQSAGGSKTGSFRSSGRGTRAAAILS